MIRVNLLPAEETRRQRGAGRIQLAAFVALILLEIAACAFFYVRKQRSLNRLDQEVEQTQTTVSELKKKVKEATSYEEKAKKLQNKLEILNQIESQSVGPVHVLEEMQTILSSPDNVEERYAQSQKNWNVEWNPRHLWIESFEEQEGSFNMVGKALDADDVAEFLHRLETAEHFQGVTLNYVRPSKQRARNTNVVEFEVDGQLTYQTESKSKQGS